MSGCTVTLFLNLTKMLSGLMSAWRMLQRLRSLRARKSCWLYERTALMWSPTSLPYFFRTSRRFILEPDHTFRQHLFTTGKQKAIALPNFLKAYLFCQTFLKNYCLPYIVINCLPYLFVGKSVAASMIDTLWGWVNKQTKTILPTLISPEWLEHQTQVLLVVEVPEQTHTMEFIIGVCIIQLLQELQLFEACLLPTRTQLVFLKTIKAWACLCGNMATT